MTPIDGLLLVAESYAKHRELSESRVATIVFNDGKRLGAVRRGADMGSRTIIRGLQWFSDNWPADLTWPADVSRPEPTPTPEPADAGEQVP